MKASRPILIFDSGVGGLSILPAITALLPDAPVIYAADNAGHPYGPKSEAEIAARVPALLGRLSERYRPCLIVIACNTAATIALAHVRAALDLPIVGTVPAIKPAAFASRTRAIGVLGTAATVRQPYVDRLVAEFASDCVVLRHGSARLVEIAEAKLRGVVPDMAKIEAEIAPFHDLADGRTIDQLVLACTHFPLLRDEIGAALPGVALVDSADGIARRTAFLLSGQAWAEAPVHRAVFTRADTDIAPLAPALAALGLKTIDIL
jgi:glutamate racemase